MEPQAPRGGQGRWRALGAVPPTLLFDVQISSWTCWGGLGGTLLVSITERSPGSVRWILQERRRLCSLVGKLVRGLRAAAQVGGGRLSEGQPSGEGDHTGGEEGASLDGGSVNCEQTRRKGSQPTGE